MNNYRKVKEEKLCFSSIKKVSHLYIVEFLMLHLLIYLIRVQETVQC